MESNLRMVERDYVVNELLISPTKMNHRLSPQKKRGGYKQFVEEQKKILATKYPFLSTAQIQKRASALWKEATSNKKNSNSRNTPKKTRSTSSDGLETLQSWLSSVRIETKRMDPSTPQTTPKLPIYKRRPPTPKAPKLPYRFDFEEIEDEDLDLTMRNISGVTHKSTLPEREELIAKDKAQTCKANNPNWIGTNSSSQFKIPLSMKKYTEGSMRSLKPPTVVENNNAVKGRGILLRQENPKSKTFRVSFSDVTSILTFEKTPFEKEAIACETDAGYTLRSKQSVNDPDASYSLRTRTVPESPNLSKSPRSPLISPLVSLPLRSPRRNRKKEEEEIRKLDLQLSDTKNRKWIPLLPTTPPILVKLKGSNSQSQSSEPSEPESPFPINREKNSRQSSYVPPHTPQSQHNQELLAEKHYSTDNEPSAREAQNDKIQSQIKVGTKVNNPVKHEETSDGANPQVLEDNDLHLQLSPSGSEDSSLPDLAGYDKTGKVIKRKVRTGESGETNGTKRDYEGITEYERNIVSGQDESQELDHYSTASEESQSNEVYYDASGYDADDSDEERESQLAILHSNQRYPDVDYNAEIQGSNDTNRPNEARQEPNKLLKQKCITQYFERSSRKSDEFKVNSQRKVTNNKDEMHTTKSDTAAQDSIDSLRKVSIAERSDTSTPRTPRTPRRLPFRSVTRSIKSCTQEESHSEFFHTPQTRRKIPSVRQTPSRTAPAFTQQRRSSRLQAKLAARGIGAASDSKTMISSKFREMSSIQCKGNSLSKKGRKPKKRLNMNETSEIGIENEAMHDKRHKEDNRIAQVKDTYKIDTTIRKSDGEDNAISPIKFYGTRSKTTQRQETQKEKSISDIENKTTMVTNILDNTEEIENDKNDSTFEHITKTKLKTKKVKKYNARRKGDCKRTRLSLCNIKTGTIDIDVQRKRGANRLSTVSPQLKGWNIFDTDMCVKKPMLPLIDPLDNFFGNDSSPDNGTSTMKHEGLETVERTVQSMREAAMNGSFASPFSSSPKLAKLLDNCSDNFGHETVFSDVSSQRSCEENEINADMRAEQQEAAQTTPKQITKETGSAVTSGSQTFLSDMFGEMTPPDKPKRTQRRLCISGRGKDENNFNSMFDAPGCEDDIFM